MTRFEAKVREENADGTLGVTIPQTVARPANVEKGDRVVLEIVDVEKADETA